MKYKRELILTGFVLIVLWPLLYHQTPLHFYTPDIQYVKAKVLWVKAGDLFADPISGYPTFHPPYYHLFLVLLSRLGIEISTQLLWVTIANNCLLFFFGYLLLRRIFGVETALISTLLMPFIIYYMGYGNPLLPASFRFSVPFYMAGLWLYTKEKPATIITALSCILWAIAFLVSPVYLFLIGFTFLYELLFKKDYRRFLLMAAVFLLAIIPFYIQAYAVYKANLAGTAAFRLWRGVPDGPWLKEFMTRLLSPVDGNILSWQVGAAIALSAAGVAGMWKSRPIHAFAIIAILAYLFTAYHFSSNYAIRVHMFVSLFLVGYAVKLARTIKIPRSVSYALVILLAAFGLVDHLMRSEKVFAKQQIATENYEIIAPGLMDNLGNYIEEGSFILATDRVYRHFIMPYFRVHGLLAYRTGEYYQLKTKLSEKMLADYNSLMKCYRIDDIEGRCRKYNINTAVVPRYREMEMPVFKAIAGHWRLVYHDPYFLVYRRAP
jgi:hypothetical protein